MMQSASTNLRSSVRRAFTLIELLVVMGIITLIIAFALPAFRFMNGDKSVEAGQNVLAAMLGTARADAVGLQQAKGVAIYREAASGRVAAALVEYKTGPTWASGATYSFGSYASIGALPTATFYMCILPHTASAATTPPNATYWKALSAASNTLFNASQPIVIDSIIDSDRVLLPTGIDCRGAGNTLSGIRYFNPTVILFDGNGTLTTSAYYFIQDGALGPQIDASTILPTPASAGAPFQNTSQIGLILFDDELFKSINPSPADPWLDANATPVMINRYNGTLVKGE